MLKSAQNIQINAMTTDISAVTSRFAKTIECRRKKVTPVSSTLRQSKTTLTHRLRKCNAIKITKMKTYFK